MMKACIESILISATIFVAALVVGELSTQVGVVFASGGGCSSDSCCTNRGNKDRNCDSTDGTTLCSCLDKGGINYTCDQDVARSSNC
jgi:hypothetical protein